VSDFVKQFSVCVLACFLLCNSIFAVVDSPVDDAVEVISGAEVPALPETVVSLVDSVSDLVDSPSTDVPPGDSVTEVPAGGNTVYVLTQPASEVENDVSVSPVSIDDPSVTITDISLASVAPVTPSSTSGLKSALLGILGNYDPVIVEYQYSGSNGYSNYLREIQPDYVWLCSAALLALVIYCLFKLGGGLIRG
jgi:hypothetical protein